MSKDYSERDLHLFCRGEIRTDGWKSQWRKDFERRHAEEAFKPRPIVTQLQIKERRIRSKDAVTRTFTGVPCMSCGKPLRNGSKGAIHERCARLRNHCDCGCVLKINWPHPVCGGCIRAAQRETTLVGKRICAEPGCGRVLQVNCALPKCYRHAAKLRAQRYAARKRQKRAEMREAA